jgi:hypothetical protein
MSFRRLQLAVLVVAAVSPAFAQRAPGPAPTGLPREILSLACKPSLVYEEPPTPLRVTGSQEAFPHRSFAPGDLITINAGTDNGIDVGQEFYTRRVVPIERRRIGRDNPATIQTTGWIRVYAVDKQMSLATITYACDSVEPNDYLEPLVLPAIPAVDASAPPPQRGNYGHVLRGSDNRQSFGQGDYFMVDRGSDHGVRVGTRFVVYRDNHTPGNFLFELGEAVAVDVQPESSTLLTTLSRDAFIAGDYIALRK